MVAIYQKIILCMLSTDVESEIYLYGMEACETAWRIQFLLWCDSFGVNKQIVSSWDTSK